MIPGVISTGLESWGTERESIQYFRKRLWGSWSMMRALVLDKASWKKHIMLDRLTGLDPPGVKLRAAQGFGESCSRVISSSIVLRCEMQDFGQGYNTSKSVSRLRFHWGRDLLTPNLRRCCRLVRDLFEWGQRPAALTATQLHYWVLDLGQDTGKFGSFGL